jgi:nickel-dependent lactate racemase
LAEVHGPAPWRCHPWLLDDNASVLAIGSCEPHYFAGITGAHKTATIGCAAHESIQANHAGALSDQARPCQLAGNPVHEGIAAMVGGLTARRDLVAVNLLQLGRRVLAAAAGGPLEALDRLAEAVRQAYVCTIDRPADALVLEVPGVLGRSFYQADKAIKNNEWSVRDGGCLVLVAACPDGVGQDDFLRLLRPCRSYDAIAESLRRQGYRLGDHKAVRLRYLTDHRGVRVAVVSDGLRRPDADLLGLVKAESPPAALEAAGIDPQSDRVYHVADAGHTCLVVEPPLPPPRLDSPETRPGGRF